MILTFETLFKEYYFFQKKVKEVGVSRFDLGLKNMKTIDMDVLLEILFHWAIDLFY